jgi:hypothetical protein
MIDKQISNILRIDSFAEKLEFQKRVLKQLRKQFPETKFTAERNPDSIRFSDEKTINGLMGLANLRRLFLASAQMDIDLKRLVGEYFGNLTGSRASVTEIDWLIRQSRLLPQLINDKVSQSMKEDIEIHPFTKNISIALVMDSENSENTFQYLNRRQAEKWNQNFDELLLFHS